MADKNQLAKQVALMKNSFFDEGYLNTHFLRLEELQAYDDSNFVEETFNLFFTDSAQVISNIEQGLDDRLIDYQTLDRHIHKIKGSSSSIGAIKITDISLVLRDYCRAENAEGCKKALEQLKMERATLKEKLETYFHLTKQTAGPADDDDGSSSK